MYCGLCDSGISATEKFKYQKNGHVHRYVYYGCAKSKNVNCKGGSIEEKPLIIQFRKLIDSIGINEKNIKEKITKK